MWDEPRLLREVQSGRRLKLIGTRVDSRISQVEPEGRLSR
jgi:hypothetical protein